MSTTTGTKPKTAHDLIGYEGKDLIRIKGTRAGRATWNTVLVKDKYSDGAVILKRVETTPEGDTVEKFRWVDADTEVELLKRPIGLLIELGGDQWIRNAKGDMVDASGCIVEIVDANRKTKAVTAWVRHALPTGTGQAKGDEWGDLDGATAGFILDEKFSKDNGDDGLPRIVSLTYLRESLKS